ncbi:hypothetical protein NDN08_001776 [Rhodosorus marinus]|uniref:Glycosyltransferase 2-like domain-containing protein n=1 Tax=Rhodosorus marinus TaxID=101924 RepID=A0AAV8URW7_9RHOD|nr:hypothetical protein NDN08_001776 [Rhodosorus marinus]
MSSYYNALHGKTIERRGSTPRQPRLDSSQGAPLQRRSSFSELSGKGGGGGGPCASMGSPKGRYSPLAGHQGSNGPGVPPAGGGTAESSGYEEVSKTSSYSRSPRAAPVYRPFQRTRSGVEFDLEKEEGKPGESSGESNPMMDYGKRGSRITFASVRKTLNGGKRSHEKYLVVLLLLVPFLVLSGMEWNMKKSKAIVRFGSYDVVNRSTLTSEALVQLQPNYRSYSIVNIPALKGLRNYELSKVRSSDRLPRYSIVAACKDKLELLTKSLPSWLNAIGPDDEIVLVDWSSRMSIKRFVDSVRDQRVLLVNVIDQPQWILSRAYNVGFRLASGDMVLKVDCDTIVSKDFFKVNTLSAEEGAYGRIPYERARTENEQHLTGVLFVPRERIVSVHAYDERIASYGYEDTELIMRLENIAGLKAKELDIETLRHVQSSGNANVPKRMYSTQLNAVLLKDQENWAKAWANQQSIMDAAIEDSSASSAIVKLTTRTQDLSATVSASTLAESQRLANGRVLHDALSVPWDVIGELEVHPGELLSSIDRLGSFDDWTKNGGFIFAELCGSAEERMLALSSVLALSVKYTKPLFISWDFDEQVLDSHGRPETPGSVFDLAESSIEMSNKNIFFSVKKLSCRTGMELCLASDSAYQNVVFAGDLEVDAELVKAVLSGSIPGKRSVLFRLKGDLNNASSRDKRFALESIVPVGMIDRQMRKVTNVHARTGVYIGEMLMGSHFEKVSQHLAEQQDGSTSFFIVGSVQDAVDKLQSKFCPEYSEKWFAEETSELQRGYAEVLILSRTKRNIHHGRCSPAILRLLHILGSEQGIE